MTATLDHQSVAPSAAASADPVGRVGHLPYAFFEGDVVPLAEARVSVATHALQYGTSAFGGIRGYRSADGRAVHLFRLQDHYRRFAASAKLLRIALPLDVEGLCTLSAELTRRNGHLGEVYLRPFCYKAGLDLTPGLSGIADGFALFMLAIDGLPPLDHGLSVSVSSWQRVTDNAIPPRGKIGGSYVNASLIRDEAREHGFDDAIVLNARGKAGEGSVSNLFMVRDGTLITPPVSGDILEGINRKAVLELAADLRHPGRRARDRPHRALRRRRAVPVRDQDADRLDRGRRPPRGRERRSRDRSPRASPSASRPPCAAPPPSTPTG